MPQNSEFSYDVFLSHSSKDKAAVRPLAERLRADGLKVWFDEWVLKPGDSIPAKIEEGLEHSRVLVLCMSAQAFGSDWAQLEAGTFRFRDPLNRERRFIPLRLDDAPIKGSLAQFLYINWLPAEREREYAKLLEASRLPAKATAATILLTEERLPVAVESNGVSALFPKLPRSLGFQFLQVVDQTIDLLVALPCTHALCRKHFIAVTRVAVVFAIAMCPAYDHISTRRSPRAFTLR